MTAATLPPPGTTTAATPPVKTPTRPYRAEVVNTIAHAPHKYVTKTGEEREGRRPVTTRRLFLTAPQGVVAVGYPRHLRVVRVSRGGGVRYVLGERRESRPNWWDRCGAAPVTAGRYTRRADPATGRPETLDRPGLLRLLGFLTADDPYLLVRELDDGVPLAGDDRAAALARYATDEGD